METDTAPQHTPSSEPAPAPETHTPATNTPDPVLQDLETNQQPDPAAPAAPATGDTPTEQKPEDDASLIKSREHYLNEMRKLREKEAEVEKLRLELEAKKGEQKPEPDPAPSPDDVNYVNAVKQAYEVFQQPLNPDHFEGEGDKVLVGQINALKTLANRLADMVSGQADVISRLEQNTGQVTQSYQEQQAQRVYQMLEGGRSEIEKEYGISVTAEDVGASLKKYAKAFADANGGVLPAFAAIEAWRLDNRELIQKLAQQKGAAPAAPAAPQTPEKPNVPPLEPNTERLNGQPSGDEDRIFADLRG